MTESIISELNHIKADFPQYADKAIYWKNTIEEKETFLASNKHPIIFIGNVGVGKSSIITNLANLFIHGKATDRKTLQVTSALPIAAGRTTICEVQICSSDNNPLKPLKLVIDPLNLDEMRKEISIYAEMEWKRHQSQPRNSVKDEAEPTAIEIQRVIRNMTNYTEYQKYVTQNGIRKRQTVYPIKKAVTKFKKVEEFTEHLIERSKLKKRTQTEWHWKAYDILSLKDLKTIIENINLGKAQTAMLPKCMTVFIPSKILNENINFDQTLIDTRGLDGLVEARDDLFTYIKNPRALIVLCAGFNDAPGDTLRSLLNHMKNNALLDQSLKRTFIVLIDKGDAEQVNGANGDRVFGQDLKIEECQRSLELTGTLEDMLKERMIAFDVLQDDDTMIKSLINQCLEKVHQTVNSEKETLVKHAQQFINNITEEYNNKLCQQVDDQIKETIKQNPLPTSPLLEDPLLGMYSAINNSRYASIVYASCRRKGVYYNLNLYAAAGNMALSEAARQYSPLIKNVIDTIDDLEKDQSLEKVQNHISYRKEQYKKALINVITDYSIRVKDQIYRHLIDNENLWIKCTNEWGGGPGFKIRVIQRIKDWESRQQHINAHEIILIEEIPFLAELSYSSNDFCFKLFVRNLRALRQIEWAPNGLNVLIGANGSGKSTLLLIFKLLRIAFDRDLPEAITQVLGGSYNLKFWGIDDSEPIELGLDINEETIWRLKIITGEGKEYQTEEYLQDKKRLIFSRDTQGNLIYNDNSMVSDTKLGIRALIDSGGKETSLRKMASLIQSFSVFHDPDLWTLRHQGSNTTETRKLHSRGRNVLTLLRQWQQELPNNHRYNFVVQGLKAAFPNIVQNLDFEEAGNTLIARIYTPGNELPSPLKNEANGVLQFLVLLCNVASSEEKSLIAIDEPENNLHPYALRRFLSLAEKWAREYKVTIILATHSTVILDELTQKPEKIFVMKTDLLKEKQPIRLDELCDREWMGEFEYGDLYKQGEIGSNEDGN
ncbi:XRE family transcriptional regulator [Candidatus Magnetomorum sp. HK-1]|nr:XRE family transcriptional regulator [Candidatus Magnetomorum sp. HK-1]